MSATHLPADECRTGTHKPIGPTGWLMWSSGAGTSRATTSSQHTAAVALVTMAWSCSWRLCVNCWNSTLISLDSFSRTLGNKCHSPFYYSALRWINQCHIHNYERPAPGSARAGMPTSAMGQKLVSKVWSGAPSYQSGLAALERQNSVTSKMASTAGIRSARTYLHRYPSDFQVTAWKWPNFHSFIPGTSWMDCFQDNLYRLCTAFLLNQVAWASSCHVEKGQADLDKTNGASDVCWARPGSNSVSERIRIYPGCFSWKLNTGDTAWN